MHRQLSMKITLTVFSSSSMSKVTQLTYKHVCFTDTGGTCMYEVCCYWGAVLRIICIELYVQCVLKLLITDVEKHGICYS